MCASRFTSGFNIAAGLFLFSVHAERFWEHRCLRERKIIPICEQERCARSSSCSACRSHQMDRLQQVIILPAQKQIAFLISQVPSYLYFFLFWNDKRAFQQVMLFKFLCSVVNYDMLNLEIPTVNIVGSLVSSGIRVLVYRWVQAAFISYFYN